MAKHVKLTVVNKPGFDKALVKVVSQTHTGYNFGNYRFDTRKFVASNGIILASNLRPARDEDDKNIIWLAGNGPASKQGNTIVMSKATLAKFIVAVNEYNALFAAPVARPAAPAERCSYIVG